MRAQKRLPRLDINTNINHSPHVAILGAGASKAACPQGDKSGQAIPLMNDLVHIAGLQDIIDRHGLEYDGKNFEAAYNAWATMGVHPDAIKQIQSRIEQYFHTLSLPLEATIYDKMILGLRNKDLIATFNWDPFLAQAYQRNMDSVGHENMPRILFLHGNVMIGACADCRMKGWTNNPCDGCKKRLEPSTLLYPVGEKNYTEDPFIKSEWDELRAYLEDAYLVTVFGYSAPITDVVARSVLLEAWHNNPTSTLGNLDIIDTKPKEEIRENWSDFFEVSHHGIYKSISDNYFSLFPRRTCDAFAMATLQQDPWHENPLPETEDLAELQAWVQHLVAEEKAGKFSGLPRDGRD